MPFPQLTKEEVSTHEAGHALLVLATPLRDYVHSTRVFQQNGNWEGVLEMDGRNRTNADPNSIYEFAKCIAGPLSQIQFYPSSIAPELRLLLQNCPSLLQVMRDILVKKLSVEAHWWPDLDEWTKYCILCPNNFGPDFLFIESEIAKFLQAPPVVAAITYISQQLIQNDQLDRTQLLAIPLHSFPPLSFPKIFRPI